MCILESVFLSELVPRLIAVFDCGGLDRFNVNVFVSHPSFADVPAVHHPALQSRSLSFKHQQMAQQCLFRTRADVGWIVVLHRKEQTHTSAITVHLLYLNVMLVPLPQVLEETK